MVRLVLSDPSRNLAIVLARGCLGKDRIATLVTLSKRAATWTQRMNDERRKIDWRFTRAKARTKFGYSRAKSSAGGTSKHNI